MTYTHICCNVEVSLNDNNLGGEIPSQLWSVTSLIQVNLGSNGLSGTLSESVSQLDVLNSFRIRNNFMRGNIPDTIGKLKNLKSLQLSNNLFSGKIPESIWNLRSLETLELHENHLSGTVPSDFCEVMDPKHLSVDDSLWFKAEPEVDCDCCETTDCYMSSVNFDRSDFPCPESNILGIEFSSRIEIHDLIANVTLDHESSVDRFDMQHFCLSPTGCYSVKSTPRNLEYQIGYSALSGNLTDQNTCDAVEICGTIIDSNDPRRKGLNILTQVIQLNTSLLNDTSVPESRALCWLLTEDERYHEYMLCDGTLVQRYVLASLFFSQLHAVPFEDFSNMHTCDWLGVSCDNTTNFVEELNLDNETLRENLASKLSGTVVHEIGQSNRLKPKLTGAIYSELSLLSSLKKINFRGNTLNGTIARSLFTRLPNLIEIDLRDNEFSGTIPDELLTSQQLRVIELANNKIIGNLRGDIMYGENIGEFTLL